MLRAGQNRQGSQALASHLPKCEIGVIELCLSSEIEVRAQVGGVVTNIVAQARKLADNVSGNLKPQK
jgi:hypothetical protein